MLGVRVTFMVIFLMVVECGQSVGCGLANPALVASELCKMVWVAVLCVVLCHSVYSVQFEHFPVLHDSQYRDGKHRGQGVGEVVVREKNGDVQDLIDFVNENGEDDNKEIVGRHRVKHSKGIFHPQLEVGMKTGRRMMTKARCR